MSSKDPQADYDQALALKDAGNAAFKSGDFKGALKNYSRIFMHIGMNPCMNMSQMMGGGGGGAPPQPQQSKDPLQQKTDALRLTAFNNMAAVYAKMQKWDDCKEKCTRVLKHDEKNTKALFRRGMAQRKLNLYELARADLEKAKEILNNKKDPAIERELKLLNKDEKNADKEFYAKMKKQMQKAKKKKAKKKAEKKEAKKKKAEEEAKKDDNPNLKANVKDKDDDAFMWDVPANDDGNDKGGDKTDKSKDNDTNKDDTKKEDNNKETKKEEVTISTSTEDKDKSKDNKDDNNKDKTSDKTSTEQPSEF